MDNTDSEGQGGNTPSITAEFIEQTFSRFSRTLKELTDWKQHVNKIFSKNFLNLNLQLYCSLWGCSLSYLYDPYYNKQPKKDDFGLL